MMPTYTDPDSIADPPLAEIEDQTSLMESGQGIENDYTVVPGVCILPVAESPPTDPALLAEWSPVAVIRLHSPYRIRRVRYSSHKTNNPQVIPSPVSSGRFVFTGGTISFGAPSLNQSLNTFDWDVTTEYVYVENCVSRTIDGFILGTPPFQWMSQVENLRAAGGVQTPAFGAIATGGLDSLVGYGMSQDIHSGIAGGFWTYNCPSYFPGNLFNDNLVNGGLEPSPYQPLDTQGG